ncbi:MAG: hypothetical protein U0R17_06890 [Acidimicrobiia bacterium]
MTKQTYGDRISNIPVGDTTIPLPPHLRRPLAEEEFRVLKTFADYLDTVEVVPENGLIRHIIASTNPALNITEQTAKQLFDGVFHFATPGFSAAVRRLVGLPIKLTVDECKESLRFAAKLVALAKGDPRAIPTTQQVDHARKEKVIVPSVGIVMPPATTIRNRVVGKGSSWANVVEDVLGSTPFEIRRQLYLPVTIDDVVKDYKAVHAWKNKGRKPEEQVIVSIEDINDYAKNEGGLGYARYKALMKKNNGLTLNTIRGRAGLSPHPSSVNRVNRQNYLDWDLEKIVAGFLAAWEFDGGEIPTLERCDELSKIQTRWMNEHNGSLEGIESGPEVAVPSLSTIVEKVGGITKLAAEIEKRTGQELGLSEIRIIRMARFAQDHDLGPDEMPKLVREYISCPTVTRSGLRR